MFFLDAEVGGSSGGDVQWTRGGLQWFQPSEIPGGIPKTTILFSREMIPRISETPPTPKLPTLPTVRSGFSLMSFLLPKNLKMYTMMAGIGVIVFCCCCLFSICYGYRRLLNEIKKVPERVRIMLDSKDCCDGDCNFK